MRTTLLRSLAPAVLVFSTLSLSSARVLAESGDPELTLPTIGWTFDSDTVSFVWSEGSDVVSYRLGVSDGFQTLFDQDTGHTHSVTFGNLPTDGRLLYVTLSWHRPGFNDGQHSYTFNAVNHDAPPEITSPASGSILRSDFVTFTWRPGPRIYAYELLVGTQAGSGDLYENYFGMSAESAAVFGLPTDGRTVYVELMYWKLNSGGQHFSQHYQYTALTAEDPAMTCPLDGATLGSSNVTFTWRAGWGADEFQLFVGRARGEADLFHGRPGLDLSARVEGLPTDGSMIHATLWFFKGGRYHAVHYTYTALTVPVRAEITAPTQGTPLTSTSQTFTWDAGTGITGYWLRIGTARGGNTLCDVNAGVSRSWSVANLPSDGSTIYVSLYSWAGRWMTPREHTFTAMNSHAGDPAMTSATLGSGTATFTWSAGTNISAYGIEVGTGRGTHDICNWNMGTRRSATVRIPASVGRLYVRLSWIEQGLDPNGNVRTWKHVDYSYTVRRCGGRH